MCADKALATSRETATTTDTFQGMDTTTDTSLAMDTTTEHQGPFQDPRVAPSVVRDQIVDRVQRADLGAVLQVDQDLALVRGPSVALGVALHLDYLVTEDQVV